ncbi:flippase [Photobacterium leiognathi]|uniref:flippase n=1 Tax=Photobacterium leiognathi TaxID=553611 RepID=UPI0029823ED9|nr:flippase [Photobacterium leiognathi]
MINRVLNRINTIDGLIKVIKNSSWLLIDKVFRIFLGVFVSAWVARYLGPEEYGKLAYAMAVIGIFQVISLCGFDGIVVRDISKEKSKANIILGTAFYSRILSGIICFILVSIVSGIYYGFGSKSQYLIIIFGSSLLFQCGDVVDLWFQSQSESKRTVIVKLSCYILSSLLKVSLILLKADVIYFAFVMALEFAIVSLGLFFSYKKFPTSKKWKFKLDTSRLMLKESWPFILSGISVLIYMRIDQVMIEAMMGSHSLGIYAAVIPFSSTMSFLPSIIFTSILPMVTKYKTDSIDKYEIALKSIFRLFAVVGWLISLCLFFSSDFLVSHLLGNSYYEGINVIKIYAFTNIFICMGVAQGVWILNENKSKISLYRTLMGAGVCIVGNYIFIPLYGLIGAAYVALFAQILSAVLSNILFSKKIFFMQMKAIVSMGLLK